MNLPSEQQLIKKLLDPNTIDKAFTELVETYQERLYWHIRKIVLTHDDTDDVLQNTFIKVFKHISKFNQKSKLHTWMYRIAYNESIDFLRQKQNNLKLEQQEFQEYLIENLRQDNYFDGDEITIKLQEAILKLPEKQAIVFQMKYFDKLKFSEISQILEISEGGLKASYHHAVKKIRHLLQTPEFITL